MPTVTARYRRNKTYEVTLGDQRLIVDVPPQFGGEDRGPTPSELFVASLGTCVAAFIAYYCERARLDTTGLEVAVSYEQRTAPSRIRDLTVVVTLPHEDVAMHRAALMGAAEHCPISESIETIKGIDVRIRGADTAEDELV